MKNLSTEEWARVDALFAQALERPPEERTAFVRANAGGDDVLLHRVTELLQCEAEAAATLGEMAASYAEPLLAALESETDEDMKVGPYRLLREIDRGGMAVVYLAERTDGVYDKQVALKLVKRGMDTDEIVGRFRRERRLLASLEHPNIARLYDGGVTEADRPYFVLEYIEGSPITQYCETHFLSIDARLALFQTVCRAVHYAHQSLIVHRDLKPGNILVTEDGQVKLLDFGIAKLLAEERARSTLPTREGHRWMTPEYATPEQIREEPITTTTDVYQLGLILYELLTGVRAFDFEGCTPSARDQIICEQNPARPSIHRYPKALRGDLDTIVLKALRKDPSRRYASAEMFAEDIERHLSGLPVVARPDTLAYRSGKFIRRHRWGLGVAASVFIMIAALTGFYAFEITQQRDRAQFEAQKAQKVSGFLTNVLAMTDPHIGRGRTITPEGILDIGARRITDELSEHPEVQVDLMNVIGSAYRNLGLYRKALAQHEHALVISERHLGPASVATATTQNNLGEVLYYLGRYETAAGYYQRSLAARRAALGDSHADIGQSLNNLALVDRALERYDSAERRLREAEAIFSEQLGNHWRTANAISNLARILVMQKRYDEAADLYSRALAMHMNLPSASRNEIATAMSRTNFGVLLRLRGEYAAAEEAHRRALTDFRRLLKKDHPFIGIALYRLGLSLQDRDLYAQAEEHYREALQIFRRTLPDNHADIRSVREQMSTLEGTDTPSKGTDSQ